LLFGYFSFLICPHSFSSPVKPFPKSPSLVPITKQCWGLSPALSPFWRILSPLIFPRKGPIKVPPGAFKVKARDFRCGLPPLHLFLKFLFRLRLGRESQWFSTHECGCKGANLAQCLFPTALFFFFSYVFLVPPSRQGMLGSFWRDPYPTFITSQGPLCFL